MYDRVFPEKVLGQVDVENIIMFSFNIFIQMFSLISSILSRFLGINYWLNNFGIISICNDDGY